MLVAVLAVAFLALSHVTFAQCPTPPSVSLTINEFQYAISTSDATRTNYLELKGPAGQSLSCIYLVAFDTNCNFTGALDLTGSSIVTTTDTGSDAGYFVVTQNAAKYSSLYGRLSEVEANIPDLNDGPASVQIRYLSSAPPKVGTTCSNIGGSLYDAVGYASSAGVSPLSFAGETQEINPGLAANAGGSLYRVSDLDTQNNHLDFAKGSEQYATPGAPNPGPVLLSVGKIGFPDTAVGDFSPSSSVTLTNAGAVALSISSIVSTGTNSGDYLVGGNCPVSSTLAVGASCQIDVTFQPAQTGLRTASVSITDSATGSPQSVSLSGTGITGPAYIFSDDFGDKELDNPLWTRKGTWSAASGDAVGTASTKADLISPDFGKPSKCTFEADMKVQAGGLVSLFAWNKDSKNNVEIRLMLDKKKLFVKQKGAGLAVSKSISYTFLTNTIYKFKATYNGSTIQVFVNDVLQVTLTPVAVPSGNLFFRVKSGTGASLSGTLADIKVY